MGFMAGFGAAFSESFNKDQERIHEKEQDMFRATYDDYKSQRDYRQEINRENAKATKLAKSLTEANGQPPETWTKAYEMLSSGATPQMVQEFLETNSLIVGAKRSGTGGTQVPGQEQPQQQQPQGAGPQMDAGAMGASAGQPGEPPAPNAQEPKKTGFDNLLGGLFSKSVRDKRKREQAMQQVADATGQDIDAVKKVLEGEAYPSEDLAGEANTSITIKPKSKLDPAKVTTLEEAETFRVLAQQEAEQTGNTSTLDLADQLLEGQKAATFTKARNKAEAENLAYIPKGVVIYGTDDKPIDYMPATKRTNEQGEEEWVNATTGEVIKPDGVNIGRVRPMTEDMEEEIDNIYKDSGKQIDAYNERVLALKQIARDSLDMQQIVADHPEALNMGGAVAQWIDRTARNITGVIDLFTGEDGTTVFDTQDQIVNQAFIGAEGKEDDGRGFSADGVDALRHLEERMLKLTGGKIQNAAIARALLESKAIRMTYAWAATQNQKGRAVSNEEFTKIYNSVLANGNPTAFGMEHRNFMNDMTSSLKSDADMLNTHNHRVGKFKDRYGFAPHAVAKPIEEILAADPETLKAMEAIESGNYGKGDQMRKRGDPSQAAPEDTGLTTNEDLVPIGKTPEGKTVYQNKKTGEQGTIE